MTDLKQTILQNIKENISIFLIGQVDSGKTYFVLNELITFLKKEKINVKYFKDCNQIVDLLKADIVIIDEVETLLDKEYLESHHPEENPYYSKEYLNKVKQWHEKLKQIKQPCIYIITRNSSEDIDYFLKNINSVDWDDRKIVSILFER
ncbi:hypothetical protein ACFLZ0_00425 [Patescibacteria group bacterium]